MPKSGVITVCTQCRGGVKKGPRITVRFDVWPLDILSVYNVLHQSFWGRNTTEPNWQSRSGPKINFQCTRSLFGLSVDHINHPSLVRILGGALLPCWPPGLVTNTTRLRQKGGGQFAVYVWQKKAILDKPGIYKVGCSLIQCQGVGLGASCSNNPMVTRI